jgi:DNA-binding CsgD family transcriptional regulator
VELIHRFAQGFSEVISAEGAEDTAAALVRVLKALTGADDGSVLHYADGRLPEIAYAQPVASLGHTTLDAYLSGPFLLDPFYRAAAIDRRFGVFRLSELAPKGFKESEYYRSWYRNCGYQDECGLLISLNDGGFINIALGLTEANARFGKRQAQLLSAILPSVAAICQQRWAKAQNTSSPAGLREQLHASLAAFGDSVLTRRERQVTELVLLGHSTRIIAEKLGISSETVKLHRKHAYAKLDVSSQAELFYLFMEALAHSAGQSSEIQDPLIAYHAKPST